MANTFKILAIAFLLSFVSKIEFSSSIENAKMLCSTAEKQAILTIHTGVTNTPQRPSSWIGEDCCTWEGVGCDKRTGSVITLKLSCDWSYEGYLGGGYLDPSLQELKHLKSLNLSQCDFNQTSIPDFIGSLQSLEYLDLSYAGFSGKLPYQLGNLTNLRYIDLSYMLVENLESLGNLSKLNHLDIKGGTKTSPSVSEFQWISLLSHLEYLDMSETNFGDTDHSGTFLTAISNLTSLTHLQLSDSNFKGEIPQTLGNLCKLEYIDLSYNRFSGDITEILSDLSKCVPPSIVLVTMAHNQFSGSLTHQLGNLKNLNYLDLSGNSLNGSLPESLGDLSELETLNIGYNLFEGVVTKTHLANLRKLSYLRASNNSLILNVSSTWIPSFQLNSLSLASWNFGSHFPIWLKTQTSLNFLDFSSSGISDEMPTWFWNMISHIPYVHLSHNEIKGEIPPIPLHDLGTPITLLDLSNNNFSGNLSAFLCNSASFIKFLDLSDNFLSGDLSQCWMNWKSLESLKLNNNNFSGNITSSMGLLTGLVAFHVRNNSLSGKVPSVMQNWNNLASLDLGKNKFSGSLPPWIGTRLPNLIYLSLRSNGFMSEIPRELCNLIYLQTLDLADNNLSRTIPRCFGNFSAMVANNLSDAYRRLDATETALLTTKGQEREYNNIVLKLVTNMDLSNNRLSGVIPQELTHLLALRFLNLSHNHLTDSIPSMIGNMESIESLDLSNNQLKGKIPQSMSNLTSLNSLGLSNNRLVGRIPTGSQLQRLEETSFIGNDGLCGLPLQIVCDENGSDKAPNTQQDQHDDNEDRVEEFYLVTAFAPGFAVGLAGIFAVLIFVESWRFAFFEFVIFLKARLFVCFK